MISAKLLLVAGGRAPGGGVLLHPLPSSHIGHQQEFLTVVKCKQPPGFNSDQALNLRAALQKRDDSHEEGAFTDEELHRREVPKNHVDDEEEKRSDPAHAKKVRICHHGDVRGWGV